MRFRVALAATIAIHAGPAAADIDESAYRPAGAVRSERERERLKKQFDLQRAAEAAAEERRLEETGKAEAEARARYAARPYDERITERTCTLCHAAGNYSGKRHSWLYWRLVVARMVWINGAPVPAADRAVIAGYLARTFPATAAERVVEYGLPLAAVGVLAAAGLTGWRLWARRLAGGHDEG